MICMKNGWNGDNKGTKNLKRNHQNASRIKTSDLKL